jgi:hypothetical protein
VDVVPLACYTAISLDTLSGVTINLLWAWILIIPVSTLLAAIIHEIAHLFIH